MTIDELRTLAETTAARLDASPNVTEWPGVLNDLAHKLCELLEPAGICAEEFADVFGLDGTHGLDAVAFVQTDAPELPGIGEETAAELAAWATHPGAGFVYGSYGRIACLAGSAWPLDAFTDGALNAADYLATPSQGPHSVIETLVAEGFLFSDDATPTDAWTVGEWGHLPSDSATQLLILSDESGEQAILAAPHLVTADRPLPIFWCDWMDEIGVTYLGGTTQQALRTLMRRGIEALVLEAADLLELSKNELRDALKEM